MANYTHSRLIVKIKPGVEELWLAAIENHTWINNSVFEPLNYQSTGLKILGTSKPQ